jgi:hypothetical protein
LKERCDDFEIVLRHFEVNRLKQEGYTIPERAVSR